MIAHSFGQELLERYGSPLYVYDLDEAERQAKALFELLPKSAQVLYSVKANPIPELCAALKTAGCRVEIAAPSELEVVLEAGFTPDRILCSGPGKTVSVVREMLQAGVTHFSCDSWYDLERLSAVALEAKVTAQALLRLQVSGAPTGSVGVGAMQSHFGADPAELLHGGAARAGALRGAELAGIHIYSGGQIQSAEKLAKTFEHAIHLAEEIVQAGLPLRVLDLGGGFPWPFGTSDAPVDISALKEKLQRVNALRRLTAEAELWFESGRYLVASCGTLLSTVLDVKVANDGKTHIILDTGMVHLGGMAGLGRIYRAVASIEPLGEPRAGTPQPADVMGPTDYALDYVARETSVPPLQAGDRVAIPNVGAYGLTASLVAFAGLELPVEVCCRGTSVVAAHRLRTGHERLPI
ncbi:MAG: type III PLP-dependent enzyme [Blastocatellia bacterium]|nr:type III PLP-dependent enzyme [Blastocatellia bacterium]